MQLTPIQFERAYALALAHRHEWALAIAALPSWERPKVEGKITPPPEWADREVSLEEIMESTRAWRVIHRVSEWQAAISWPEIAPDHGYNMPPGSVAVVHTTATGRVSWRVRRDGMVTLDVYRPVDGLVLRALVYRRGNVDVAQVDRRPFYGRHVGALWMCLVPLIGVAATNAALAEASSAALPEEVETASEA